jgi:hypothetical protein
VVLQTILATTNPDEEHNKEQGCEHEDSNTAAKELKIFETILLSGLKARRRPRNKSTIAIANRTRLAHGNSRVIGHRTNTSG